MRSACRGSAAERAQSTTGAEVGGQGAFRDTMGDMLSSGGWPVEEGGEAEQARLEEAHRAVRTRGRGPAKEEGVLAGLRRALESMRQGTTEQHSLHKEGGQRPTSDGVGSRQAAQQEEGTAPELSTRKRLLDQLAADVAALRGGDTGDEPQEAGVDDGPGKRARAEESLEARMIRRQGHQVKRKVRWSLGFGRPAKRAYAGIAGGTPDVAAGEALARLVEGAAGVKESQGNTGGGTHAEATSTGARTRRRPREGGLAGVPMNKTSRTGP